MAEGLKPYGWLAAGIFFDRSYEMAQEQARVILGSNKKPIPLYSIPDDQVLIPRALLAALLDGDSNVSLVAAHELRGLLEADRQK